MNIAAITQQRTCSTAHLLAASPFAQKQLHPFLAETSQDNRDSKLSQIADRMVDKFEKPKALDQQIQSYQDIIDNESDSINEVQKEYVLRSLDRTKQLRNEYLQQGAKHLNRYADVRTPDGKYFGRMVQNAFSKNPFAQKQASDWMIDISAL